MNELIKAFPKVRQRVEQIGKFSFDEKLNQTEQTKEFIKKLGISEELLEGVCF